jgi:hypothetical protein
LPLVAKLDGDEIGYPVVKVAEIMRQKCSQHLEKVMNDLRESFDDVADWCEKHLEAKRGREFGMIFGALLRVYGRLATLPDRLHGEQRAVKEQELNARAEELLLALTTRSFVTYRYDGGNRPKLMEANSMRTNMIYDGTPRPRA